MARSFTETRKLQGVDLAAYLLEVARAHERAHELLPSDFFKRNRRLSDAGTGGSAR